MVFAMLLSFAGCGGGYSEEDAASLVKWNLESIYLGEHDPAFISSTRSTEEELDASYEEGIFAEVDFFIYYVDIEYPTEEIRNELAEVYKEIYSKSKFEVKGAERVDEITFKIETEIYPIDIMEHLLMNYEDYLTDLYAEYADVDMENMTMAEYQEYDEKWAACLIEALRAQIPEMGYNAPETVTVEVKYLEDEEVWQMTDESFSEFDARVIEYP